MGRRERFGGFGPQPAVDEKAVHEDDRLTLAQRSLERPDQAEPVDISETEIRDLLQDLGIAEPGPDRGVARSRIPAPVRGGLLALLGASLLVGGFAVGLWTRPERPRPASDAFQARGAEVPVPVDGCHVRSFCVKGSDDGPPVVTPIRRIPPHPGQASLMPCAPGSTLTFTVTQTCDDGDLHLLLVVLDSSGKAHLVTSEGSVPVRPGVVDEAVPAALVVSSDIRPGPLTEAGVFTSRRIPADEAATAIRGEPFDPTSFLARLRALPSVFAVDAFDLRIAP